VARYWLALALLLGLATFDVCLALIGQLIQVLP
jgi:hypothetical protein